MDERAVVLEGYLIKSPPEEKIKKNYKWHKRYFKLWSDCTLEYFKKEGDPLPIKEPIDLNSCLGVIETDKKYEKHFHKGFKWPFCLNMQHRQYHFVSQTESQRNQWKLAIADVCGLGSAMVRSSSECEQIINNETPQSARRTTNSPMKNLRSQTLTSISSIESQAKNSRSASLTSGISFGTPTVTDSSLFTNQTTLNQITISPRRLSLPGLIDTLVEEQSNAEEASYDQLPPPVHINNRNGAAVRPHQLSLKGHLHTSKNMNFNDDDPLDLYDTPPMQRTPFTSHSLKQPRTKNYSGASNFESTGYIQMGIDNNNTGYVKVESPSLSRDPCNKQFRVFGNAAKSQTLKHNAPVLPPPPMSPKHLTLGARPTYNGSPVLDEIPVMPSNHIRDLKDKRQSSSSEDSPPTVDRINKPTISSTPNIDRSTKPRLQKQLSESSTVRRSPDWDDSDVKFDLNMSFDTSQLSSHLHRKPREDYSFHNKFLPKQFSTTHSNTQHTTQNIQRDMFFYDNTNDEETEGNYFNHKISNLPSSLKDAHLKDPDPMDNYDNFNIRNTESPPKNKFFHRQDALQLPSPNHDAYDTLKAEYEHAELPRLPPPAIPNVNNEFRENDNYTNFSSILESEKSLPNLDTEKGYVNTPPRPPLPPSHQIIPPTVGATRTGTHYILSNSSAQSSAEA